MDDSKCTQKSYPAFIDYFSTIEDPRRQTRGNFMYPLNEILFLAISAVISGADGWTSIQLFGNSKLKWLRKYFPYEKGIPSHDVIGTVFSSLDSESFSKSFMLWVESIAEISDGEIIPIDGKTICHSEKRGKKALHVVSAFAHKNGLCLGQKCVDQKSNEITAIPELLDLLTIKGCIITIDSMGCQKAIAEKIIEKKANYVLAVKGNQKELKEQIEKLFKITSFTDTYKHTELGHGRIEHREYQVIDDLRFLDNKERWKNIQTIISLRSKRINKATGKTTISTRLYISSLPAKASKIAKAIRAHWAIENNLHWNLDVVFNEDDSIFKKQNAALNYNIILKTALTIIDKEKSTKKSKPSKRLLAALDDKYRNKLLNF